MLNLQRFRFIELILMKKRKLMSLNSFVMNHYASKFRRIERFLDVLVANLHNGSASVEPLIRMISLIRITDKSY